MCTPARGGYTNDRLTWLAKNDLLCLVSVFVGSGSGVSWNRSFGYTTAAERSGMQGPRARGTFRCMTLPYTVPPAWPEVTAGRFAASIRTLTDDRQPEPGVCLIGLPDDTGVMLNHGRPGSRSGPAAFRAALARLGSPFDLTSHRDIDVVVYDAGDILPVTREHGPEDPTRILALTHTRVTDALNRVHELGLMPVCIGGGHDLTFPTVRALAQHGGAPATGINIDAHLDVRMEPGSGMPFRSLIEDGFLEPTRFVEFGIGRFSTTREHTEWLESQGGTIHDLESILDPGADFHRIMRLAFATAFQEQGHARGFVSFDLDSIDASSAPGVSAPSPFGFLPIHATLLAQEAGRTPAVRHFDIMELNPDFDVDGRTARLAALIFMNFLAGLRERL